MQKDQLIKRFRDITGSSPEVLSSAPGRINIVGEHTDYNQGYVLPAAIHRKIHFLASRRNDDHIRVWSDAFDEKSSFSLRSLGAPDQHYWDTYIKGIFWVLRENGMSLKGIDGVITGDIPIGSGLSSSAALEVSVLNGLDALFGLGIDPMDKAKLAQRAENDFVGMKCGLMDQFISVFGEEDTAILLDCRSFDFDKIPLRLHKENLEFLVYDSRVERELSLSEYNTRRKEAAEAELCLQRLGLPGYRETSLNALANSEGKMDKTLYRRARHVISENERVQKAVKALRTDDFYALGQLLFQSHASLRDDYEVSCPELDLLYAFGSAFSGCLGARLTGAGFGGSGIALVRTQDKDAFIGEILDLARKKRYGKPRVFHVQIDNGARISML